MRFYNHERVIWKDCTTDIKIKCKLCPEYIPRKQVHEHKTIHKSKTNI